MVCPPAAAAAAGGDNGGEELEKPCAIAAECLLASVGAALASARMVGAASGSRRGSREVVASAFSSHGRHRARRKLLPVFRGFSLCSPRAVRPGERPRAGRVLLPRFCAARGAHRGSLASIHQG